ncbi:hypothetical protein PAGU1678_06930 [Paraclostridium bifermentans subsp. muricolitidis]|nr:hypothetical protein PAGU1678_06930 [Paraclostridium bifermentans subsp. muricolitidis]
MNILTLFIFLPNTIYKTKPAGGTIVKIKIQATEDSILLLSLNIILRITKKLITYRAITKNSYEKITDKMIIPSLNAFYVIG